MDNDELFFGGIIKDENNKNLDLILLASPDHMIESEYHTQREYHQGEHVNVGPIPGSLIHRVLNIFRKPLLKFILGKGMYNSKIHVIKKKYKFEYLDYNYIDREERNILLSAHSFMNNRSAPSIEYQFVARRLLDGYGIEPYLEHVYSRTPPSEGDYVSRTVVASPIYLAIKSRF